MPAQRVRSSASVLALAWTVLVLYASLYPFEGWRWPPGQTLAALAQLPRSVYHDDFDLVSNLLGYMPLGLLLALGLHRPGRHAALTLAWACASGAALSFACELLQQFVPGRVPSLEDLLLNAAGTAAGALLGLALHALGWVQQGRQWQARWVQGDAGVALALLSLWPLGLLFPTPVPLGLGQVGERVREALAGLLQGVPWAAALHALLEAPAGPQAALRPLGEMLIIAAGLLAPCLVAYAVVPPGWRRVAMAFGALALAALGMTLSTWLNFGPAHALAWLSPASLPGLALGLVLALLLVPLARQRVPGLALVALTALVVGVAQAPADPYFAQSLQAWEQGRFVRFHGIAQWIGWLWPYAAGAWMLSRLGARD